MKNRIKEWLGKVVGVEYDEYGEWPLTNGDGVVAVVVFCLLQLVIYLCVMKLEGRL